MSDPIKTAPHKSSLGGLDANLMALLCYVAAFVIGLIPGIRYVAFLAPLALYFLEKGSRFVKFHAMQAFMLQLLYMLLNLILSLIGTGCWRVPRPASSWARRSGWVRPWAAVPSLGC